MRLASLFTTWLVVSVFVVTEPTLKESLLTFHLYHFVSSLDTHLSHVLELGTVSLNLIQLYLLYWVPLTTSLVTTSTWL